jgi:MoaA/NifB/PqqE/SkfB family radical SAM enzyme
MKIKNIRGFSKTLFKARVKLAVFFYFFKNLFGPKKIKPIEFIRFLRRLLYFLNKMQHNKFVSINNKTRLDLYVPGFPSNAFYTSCRKFMHFNGKLPCTTVLLSITAACVFKCKHCYQKYDRRAGKDVEINLLVETVKTLQDMGISFFNIEGGEPFLAYKRLKKICDSIDNRSEIWINSTGYGITEKRLLELKKSGVNAIMFSFHHPDPKIFNNFMGNDNAFETMTKAVQACHLAEIPVAFNSCLMKEDYFNGNFEKLMKEAKKQRAAIIQLIKPKPAGGWLKSGVEIFTESDIKKIKNLINTYNHDPVYQDYPAISAQIIEEDQKVFGCTAGGTDRFYINSKGDLQPCEFLNISFGNISRDNFTSIYNQMRNVFNEPGSAWLCEQYSADILNLFKKKKLQSLPLSPELSRKIYTNWDQGNKTELYKKIKEI